MRHVECNEECSPEIEDDTWQTWRWFSHVLPQLRGKIVRVSTAYDINC